MPAAGACACTRIKPAAIQMAAASTTDARANFTGMLGLFWTRKGPIVPDLFYSRFWSAAWGVDPPPQCEAAPAGPVVHRVTGLTARD